MLENKNNFKKKIIYLFSEHPNSIGESYFQHLRFASLNGLKLIVAGLACVIHSVLPFLFANTASSTIHKITEEMVTRKNNSLQNERY